MAKGPTLSEAIDLGQVLHDDEVSERLRRREERNREKLAKLNRQAPDETAGSEAASNVAAPDAPSEPDLSPQPSATPDRRVGAPDTASLPNAHEPAEIVEPEEQPSSEAQTQQESVAEAPSRTGDTEPRPERLPNERYLKVRNTIVDSLPRYLKGNRYTVYQYIYRNTLGRQQVEGGRFVSSVVASDLQLSEKTVRTCWKQLAALGLIELSPIRGSHYGKRIRVLDVEGAVARLEDLSSVTFTDDHRKELPMSADLIGKSYRSSSVKVTDETGPSSVTFTDDSHERHEEKTHGKTTKHAGGGSIEDLISELAARYGFATERARTELKRLTDEELALVPQLLDRLDADIIRGGIRNPAGVLVTRLRAIEEWKSPPAPSQSSDEPVQAMDSEEPYVRYIAETDARAREYIAGLDASEVEELRAQARGHAEARNPAAAEWTETQWATHLERLMIGEVRERIETFDAWLERTGNTET